MKILKVSILFAALMFSSQLTFAQQNIQFTQYIFNATSVNPAYAGYKEEWYAQLGLRSQWVGLDGAPQTASISIDGITNPVHKRHGIALQLTADKLGPQSAQSAYLNYAFRLRLDEADTKRLAIGFGLGVTQFSLDGAMLDPIASGDPTVPTGKISNFVPDLRFGIYYSSPSWYAGVSVMDLLSGDQENNIFRWDNTTTDNIRIRRHLYFITGALFDLEPGLKFRPSLLWKEDFRGPSSLDLNAMFILGEKLWLGGGWRTGVSVFERDYQRYTGNKLSKLNSFSGIIQVEATPRLRIGYSYDYIVSKLSSVQNGSHEVTLGFTFGRNSARVLSPRYF
jgi:type IX secretion system PorP/SprF family membrane protein